MAKSFYPNIGTLVTLDDFPEELQFLENGLQNVLDNIYYKELQFVQSNDGAHGYYNLVLVTGEQLKLDLFGTGFSIVINPGNAGETLIPLTLRYNWPVLALISSFSLEEFSYLPSDLQNILRQTLSLNDTDLLQTAVRVFEGGEELSNYKSLVDKVNLHYNLSGSDEIPYPQAGTSLDMIEEIRRTIDSSMSIIDTIKEIVDQVYIIDADGTNYQNNLNQFTQNVTGESIQDYIKRIIIPKIEASLSLAVGLAFPRNILIPIDTSGNPIPEPEQSILIFDAGDLEFSTQGGINFREEMATSLNYPSQIGNTGLEIDIVNAKLDLSKNSNIIEADLDGRPQDFIGIYTQYVTVTLPSRWFNNVDNSTLQLAGYNMLIGTGGISGMIALETISGQPNNGSDFMALNIGSWQVKFNYFALTFKQNLITQSQIGGQLTIPKLKDAQGNLALINIDGGFSENGDFELTASEPEGIPLTLFDFVTFNFTSLSLGRLEDDFYIQASCEIWFEDPTMDALLQGQKISIPKIRVYDNGRIEIVGGNSFIPTNVSVNLGPVEMAVTGIHFGSYQGDESGQARNYNYWGFDGAISVNPLGLDVRGEGVKYYYTVDNDEMANEYGGNPDDYKDSFIRIQSLELDLVIPGSASPESAMAIIHGALAIESVGESNEYTGEISLKLPKLKIAGGAAMRLQPDYPAFVVDAYVDLPAPIPIGPLGVYGFRGLLGYKYIATKEAVGLSTDNTWYEYYVYPPRGIHVSKFAGPPVSTDYSDPFSIGAGAVVGTSFDGGMAISIRTMLVLSLPTLFMIDGRASILSARLGLDSTNEPPFYAGAAWGPDSFEAYMGADFNLPDNGRILDLYAEVQSAFFFNNPSAWYVNFGTKSKPVSATVLTLFTAQTYLMLSAGGIETGARAEFLYEKRFGPAYVKFEAYVEVGGHISFEQPQIGGYVAVGGQIHVKVLIIKVDIAADAILAVEAAKPFLIYAELRVRGCIDLFFGKICASATVKLKWEFNPNVDRTPIAPLPNGTGNQLDRRKELVKGVHMLTNEAFALDQFSSLPNTAQINSILPMDTFVDIKTTKGLISNLAGGIIGGQTQGAHNYTDLIPPDKTVRGGHELRQVKHKYSIENIEIKANDGSGWVDYQPFKAVVAAADREQLPELLGYWQKSSKQYNTIRLLASSPFSFTESGEPGWFVPEQYGITPSELFCEGQLREPHCLDFLNKDVGTVYHPPAQYIAHYINGAYFTLEGIYYAYDDLGEEIPEFTISTPDNPHGFEKSLQFENQETLIILLPEASAEVRLKLTTDAQGATITYLTSETTDDILPVYTQIHQEYRTASQLANEVVYNNEESPIKKILIAPSSVNTVAVMTLQQQVAQLFYDSYTKAEGGVVDSQIPSDPKQYQEWQDEIDNLVSQSCRRPENPECKPDRILCDFYLSMLQLFYSCFPFPTVTIQDLRNRCAAKFQDDILIFDGNQPQYGLLEYVQPEFNIWLDLQRTIDKWGSDAEIDMRIYIEYRNLAYTIVDKIRELGDCDCGDDCNINKRLCYYYDVLNSLYFQCFVNIRNEKEVQENLECFDMVYAILERDILYARWAFPEPIRREIIPFYEQYGNYLGKIQRGNDIMANFYELKNVLEELLSLMFQLGNCDCSDNNNEPELECRTSLQQLCWTTVEDYEFNQTIPGQAEINAEYEAMVAAVEKTAQPIWRPNTHFYIHFQLKDEVDNGENEGVFNYYYGFRTVGPVGYYHKHPQVDYLPSGANPARFPLTSLRSYIDYKRSYPDAKGNLLKAKPLFYGNGQCKITLFFIKPMVYHMLNLWNTYNGLQDIAGELNIAIKDPMSGKVIPYPLPINYEEETVPIALSASWKVDPNPLLPLHMQLINNIIEYANEDDTNINCTPILGETIKPNSPNYELVLTNLKPEKLYTALVYNAFDKNGNGNPDADENEQVHEFVFKTSRYKNFREQVESYKLSAETESGIETSEAVYETSKGFSQTEIDTAYEMVSNPNYSGDTDLERQFYHLFDRVFEGVWGFTPIDTSVTTEFNRIVNINTGKTIALLIRNPEPFNNPKIPVSEIADTLRVMDNINNPDGSYKILHSRDYSQTIIMNSQKNITAANLNFLFEYKTWNGSEYVVEDEPEVPADEKLNSVYVESVLVNP